MPILGEPAPLATARELVTSQAAPRGRARRGTMGGRVDWRRPRGISRRRCRRVDPRGRAGQRCVSCRCSRARRHRRLLRRGRRRRRRRGAVGGRVDCAIAARARVGLWRGARRRRCRVCRAVARPMEPGRARRREHRHRRRPRRARDWRRRGARLQPGDVAFRRRACRAARPPAARCRSRDRRCLRAGGAGSRACGPASGRRHHSRHRGVIGRIAGDLDAARATHRRARLRSLDRGPDCDGRRRAVRPRPGPRPDPPARGHSRTSHSTLTNR